jgi:hypothetical protein
MQNRPINALWNGVCAGVKPELRETGSIEDFRSKDVTLVEHSTGGGEITAANMAPGAWRTRLSR